MAKVFKPRKKDGTLRENYVFNYVDWTEKRRMMTGYPSKRETERLRDEVLTREKKIRDGVLPPPNMADKSKNLPFSEVRDEYLAWGESQGGRGGRPWGPKHAEVRRSRLTWWGNALGLDCLADLNHSLPRVEKALQGLQADGKSNKTLHGYAESIRAFCRWCVKRGYVESDPLKSLQPFDASPKSERRAFTRDEIARLMEKAPRHRSMLYAVALSSGLRAKELRSLTVDDLDATANTLRLHSDWTKNRKAGYQPLPVGLAQALIAFAESGEAVRLYKRHMIRKDATAQGMPENPLLYVPTHPARELRRDLKAADIKDETPAGKVDFHAFRVTYVTMIVEGGATVKEAQSLARHASPTLTMNVYAKADRGRMAGVVERATGGLLPARKCITYAETPLGLNESPRGASTYMVEAAGIEPASESVSTKVSTCIVCLLGFARPGRVRLASRRR